MYAWNFKHSRLPFQLPWFPAEINNYNVGETSQENKKLQKGFLEVKSFMSYLLSICALLLFVILHGRAV